MKLSRHQAPEYSLQQPGQRQREQCREQCRGPVAQMVRRQVAHHEMIMYEVYLQAYPSEEHTGTVAPGRRDAEEVAEQDKERYRQRYVYHPFGKEGESPVAHLLQPDTRGSRHQQRYPYQPAARRLYTMVLAHQ